MSTSRHRTVEQVVCGSVPQIMKEFVEMLWLLMISMKDTCPEDIEKKLMRHAKNVHWQRWAKKHEIEELKEGVWFEPVEALLKIKVNHRCTARHGAPARSWVIGGAWAQKKALRHQLGDKQKM